MPPDPVPYLLWLGLPNPKVHESVDTLVATAYSYIVTKREKLIAKALNNPKGLSFQDFQQLLRGASWTFDHQRGSHQIWYSPTGHRLSIQEAHDGKAKGYQVEQFITQFESENENGDD